MIFFPYIASKTRIVLLAF